MGSGKGGGGGGGGSRKATDVGLFGDGGTRLDIGLNAGGEDADAAEMLEGMGDDGLDFDLGDDFQDDEADEEKQDHDDVPDIASDDEDADMDLDDDKAQKEKKKKAAPVVMEDEEEEDEEEEDAPMMPEKEEAPVIMEPEKRKAEDETGPVTKRPRTENGPLTTAEVKNEILARGGRCKLRDLLQHFKPRIKGAAANKDAIKRILKDIGEVSDDAVEGKVLVLKPQHLKPGLNSLL